MTPRRMATIAALFVVLVATLAVGASRPTQALRSAPPAPDPQRTGAWVDTLQCSTFSTEEEALDQLEAGTLDMILYSDRAPARYQRVQASPDMVSFTATGNYNEIMFNVAGPVFSGTGKLNPFAMPEVREAVNWLVDRGYIVRYILGGLGASKYTVAKPGLPDYARHQEPIQTLEATYAYDYEQANAAISAEMAGLGATLVGGKWHYGGEPVTLIFLIRVEDERRQVGDYVADQLERLGFTVDRQYKTSAEASPLWLRGDPDDGLWHLYTGGWVSTAIDRDQGSDFQYFYTPKGLPFPSWQAYDPSPEFQEAADRLAERDFATMEERAGLFADALEMSMPDSARIWLYHDNGFIARRADTTAAYDLASGFSSDLWPYTVRFNGSEGGVMDVGAPSLLVEPWNPLGGGSWLYDSVARRATQDHGVVHDPNNGLVWPQRIESAEVYAEAGLPISRTHDWVTLAFSPTIEVPGDAWANWDTTTETWITAGDEYTETQTAKIKSVVHYPSDLFSTVTWHDGSALSVGDFVMAMIMPFDVADPASLIYDESRVEDHEAFLSSFKGYRITSTDPLVIEYYTDAWVLDAELNVRTLWPDYGRGEGAWHNMTAGYLTEANGLLAFSEDKADALGWIWMDFLTAPSTNALWNLTQHAQTYNLIPYANTLGSYITPAEATARWSNLSAWYTARGHFWLGTGPFYLDTYSHSNGTLTLQRYAAFPDAAGRWDHFSHDASPATVELNYTTGAPGSAFNLVGTHFPINRFASIDVNAIPLGTVFTGPTGAFTITLTTEGGTEEGEYVARASVNPSAFVRFHLDSAEPVRPVEGSHVAFPVPANSAIKDRAYLPIIFSAPSSAR
jgi:peptide/nickel transport system substrate-binding protein